MQTLIVFSHLRWGFVYQRPQHLLSRLAQHYRVIFFEEPIFQQGDGSLNISTPIPNLTVVTPVTPVEASGFHDEQLPYLRRLVCKLAASFEDPIAWLYTPMALPLLDELKPSHVVYDCMDELSSFTNSPPHLLEREHLLLKQADIVFTGGASLYNAKKHRNPNVHCFPSSVDAEHFRRSLDRNIAHPSHQQLTRPRLGFYGVIDERFDAALIGEVAQARPDWQIILVGPVVKIDPQILPRHSNIHYLGQQSYEALPQFLAAWDVCLMPFAMNEATRFISPTKSLEYMAAELPIVSTPVKDVVDHHSDVVEIAASPQEFIDACECVLHWQSKERRERIAAMRNKLSHTSWNTTAAKIHSLLQTLDISNTPMSTFHTDRQSSTSALKRMTG